MPIFAAEMRHSWRSLLGWALGLAAVCLMYVPFYESMGAAPEMATLLDSLPESMTVGMGLDMMFTGPGYVQSSILELTAIILVIIAAVGWGSRAIAGDEEDGMLELTLAHGISRTALYSQRALAILARLALLGSVLCAVLVAVSEPFKLGLTLGDTLAAVASFTALAVAIASFTLAVGAWTGRRSVAVGAGTGFAVTSYALHVTGRQSADYGWLGKVSPFGWAFAETPIMSGWDWRGLGLLLVLTLVCFAAGLVGVSRRDIQG